MPAESEAALASLLPAARRSSFPSRHHRRCRPRKLHERYQRCPGEPVAALQSYDDCDAAAAAAEQIGFDAEETAAENAAEALDDSAAFCPGACCFYPEDRLVVGFAAAAAAAAVEAAGRGQQKTTR